MVAAVTRQGQWQGRLLARRADGSAFPVRGSVHKVFDPSQTPVALMASFVDLTRLDEMTAQAQREQAFAQAIVAAVPMMIVVLAPDGGVRDVNPFFERVTGFVRSEVIGGDWIETFVVERERLAVRRLFARAPACARSLGLQLVLTLAAQLHGELLWGRDGPHTRFEVVLPLAAPAPKRPQIPPPAAIGMRSTGEDGP